MKECSGIGTEATRAGIIEKLQTAGFLQMKGKFLEPTEKARMTVKVLPEDMIYPDTTAILEKELEEVSKGNESYEIFYRGQLQSLTELLVEAKNVKIEMSEKVEKCPKCGKPMKRYKGKNGYFWGCSGYPDCKLTATDKNGKPDFSSLERKTAKCPKCAGTLTQYKSKFDNSMYWHCGNKECGLILSDYKNEPMIEMCPKCKAGYFLKHKGKKGEFWSCSNYPECKETRQDKNGKPENKRK